jgi:hypothetical protein
LRQRLLAPSCAHHSWGVSCSDSAPCVAIGAWTDQEISRAIIHGVAPDGRMLKPPMTCAHYAG